MNNLHEPQPKRKPTPHQPPQNPCKHTQPTACRKHPKTTPHHTQPHPQHHHQPTKNTHHPACRKHQPPNQQPPPARAENTTYLKHKPPPNSDESTAGLNAGAEASPIQRRLGHGRFAAKTTSDPDARRYPPNISSCVPVRMNTAKESSRVHTASQSPALPTWHSTTPCQSLPLSRWARCRTRNISLASSVSSRTNRMTFFSSVRSTCLRRNHLTSRRKAGV